MSTAQERLSAYERQLARVQRRLIKLSMQNNTYKVQQILLFCGGVLVALFSISLNLFLGLLLLIGVVVGFIILHRMQKRVERSFLKHQAWEKMIKAQLARLQLDWAAMPVVPELEKDPNHPFEIDLDITGERSLHRLLNTGISFEGTELLADWLLERVPDLTTIRQRQALVQELAPLTRFRNKLMMNSLFATRFSSEGLDGEGLMAWLEADREVSNMPFSTLLIASLLFVTLVILLCLYVFGHLSPLLPLSGLALTALWYLFKRHEQGDLAQNASQVNVSFIKLRPIFEYLESYPYRQGSLLKQLCEPFYLHDDRRPSQLLKKLERITKRASGAQSQEGWFILNTLLPIGFYTTYQLQQYKALLTEYLPRWLDAWYDLEAYCSLANFAYLNPDYVVPEILPSDTSVETFQVRALGHPLLAKKDKVKNDIQLDTLGELVLITGSNMAGKSTFLRTMGINLCLAFAGSVVNADSFRTSLFELYGCIKVSDSLADGYSYFYAEVRRLRAILDALEQGTRYPVFFMIDEIFKGTNNYERLIGSEAYLRVLLQKKCIGSVSTHDLELVKLADSFSAIRNYHFREEVINGQMVFDYILRIGPCPTRNALKIMQMEGLPITWDQLSHR
ncbi:MutS family DNA mismatch repair protein [Tengunoibacter tsumagoiensis]|uniref:DNA mismatch repair protein n=1 Tax=Tengunoibacter tsumagoiensis TaxID=2014871 RepID=A0A402A2A7_9CHLR|nr:MutS family DNA mismatch repair protein [Tengunoibacter tsumagoiensis]GCE13131.1 DNA mismatch repair protein [Tengunoibacter tsumagoiensis]